MAKLTVSNVGVSTAGGTSYILSGPVAGQTLNPLNMNRNMVGINLVKCVARVNGNGILAANGNYNVSSITKVNTGRFYLSTPSTDSDPINVTRGCVLLSANFSGNILSSNPPQGNSGSPGVGNVTWGFWPYLGSGTVSIDSSGVDTYWYSSFDGTSHADSTWYFITILRR